MEPMTIAEGFNLFLNLCNRGMHGLKHWPVSFLNQFRFSYFNLMNVIVSIRIIFQCCQKHMSSNLLREISLTTSEYKQKNAALNKLNIY